MRRISVVFVLLALVSCSKTSRITGLLQEAEELLNDHPDSALTILLSIETNEKNSRKQSAHHALLLSQAYDKNYIDLQDDSLIRVAYDYYQKKNDPDKRARANYYLGVVQINRGENYAAMISFLQAIKWAEKSNDFRLLGLIYSQLGSLYEKEDRFLKAIANYEKSCEYYEKCGLLYHTAYAQLNMGRNYAFSLSFDQALHSYQKSMEYAIQNQDTSFIRLLQRNTAAVYRAQGHYSEAKQLLFSSYAQYNNNEIPSAYSDLLLLGTIYEQENRLDSAQYYIDQLISVEDSSLEGQAALQYEMFAVAQKENRLAEALNHFRDYYNLADSIHRKNRQNTFFETEENYKRIQLESEMKEKQMKQTFITIGLIVFLIWLSILGIIFYRRHVRIVRARDANIREQLVMLQEAGRSNSRLLSVLSEKEAKESKLKDLLEGRFSLLRDYCDLIYVHQSRPDVLARKMKELIGIKSIEEETFSDLHDIIDEKYNGVISKIKKLHPGLNESELNLICLICAGFTSQQMCVIYNTTAAQTIYTKKYRLTQKMNFAKWSELESYILEFSDRTMENNENQ